MVTENLGGAQGKLTVRKEASGSYFFCNSYYGMMFRLYPEDVDEFLNHPSKKEWGRDGRSYSNNIDSQDLTMIKQYIKTRMRKYKTVTDVIKSRSKYKEKYLMGFSMEELQEYIKKKEDKNVKVKSGC